MVKSRGAALFAASILVGLTSCDASKPDQSAAVPSASAENRERLSNQPVGKKMNVTIGTKTFTATLEDNPATAKLRAMLPLTLDMSELNGNEKLYRLPTTLPTTAANPGTIRDGDLMLWQADTLVLFYETFQTTYRYTRLGRIDEPSGLAAAVGTGSVTVTFELE
ncbi:MAG: hypothetical protein K8U57_07895 [Planctomycetes bacterium]|nr:hypothetical protein [Planctomycetota bacterium]